jgi:integrase
VATLLKDLKDQAAISAACMRFTVLTAARTKEAVGCRWADIDLSGRTRVVQILKGGKAWHHQVPLSDQAIELLRSLVVEGEPTSEFVFPARNSKGHLATSAMLALLRRMGWKDQTTTHGIRAAFKTWATEHTNYPREVVELCLSHVQGDPLERAYQRGDILEKRRRLMQDWADYCTSESAGAGNVVSLRA